MELLPGAGEPEGDEDDFSNIASKFLTPPAPEGRGPPMRFASGEAILSTCFWMVSQIMLGVCLILSVRYPSFLG